MTASRFCAGVLLWALGLHASLNSGEWITCHIHERAGVARTGECVTFGVPLPRAWHATKPTELLLRREDQAVPAQFEILSRWGSHPADTNAPAKWVLVSYLETLDARSVRAIRIEPGEGQTAPTSTLSITQAVGRIFVDTGPALFTLNTDSFNLIDQVVMSGRTLLEPLTASQAIRLLPMNGTNVVAPTASRQARSSRADIERKGPLYAVVKVVGSIPDYHGQPVLDFTARCHFYAGRSDVRLDFTVENNYPIVEGEWGQPLNVHDQGSTNSVYLGGLQLALKLASTPAPLHVEMENGLSVSEPTDTIRLYQDSSGGTNWDAYVGLVGWENNIDCAPRLQSFSTSPGFTITGIGSPVTGRRALGWIALRRTGDQGPRVQVAVRDFWQNFPKALEARTDGTVVADLFPNGHVFRHNLRVGEEKTHTLMFRFGLGAEEVGVADQCARAFQQPLLGQVEPAAMVQSGALGEVPVEDLKQWPLYERYVRVAFEPNPDFNPDVDDPSFGNTTLRETIERYNFFGWQDYGDVPLDYESFGPNQAGQMNLKYWFLYGFLVQYGRSGDPAWLDLALPAAWHLADIDYLHIPDEGPQHWAHGAYFGHSNHDEPGNINPNRNSNSPSDDLFFGVPDLLLAYCMTGETRFREVALEGLQAMRNQAEFIDFRNPVLYRERANLIFAMIEGYRHTGDTQWLELLRTIVRETADLSNKAWLDNPSSFRPAEDWQWLSSFQLSQILWTLGRYLDFCTEYGLPDDLGVANALTVYADFILRYFASEYQPGRLATWNALYFYEPHDPPYLEVNNWALVTSDALAYAYRYSGRTNYLAAAAKFYATGTADASWQDDPPVYLATKDLVNALNWGLVYMRASQPQSSWPPHPPRLLVLSHAADRTVLSWDDLGPEFRYAIEFTEDLLRGVWTPLNEGQLITSNTWIDTHPSIRSRFWRIRVER
ncbi:MAG: hypothetical protein GX456_13345 [Verrucomicrobia bacterium]|nr:hypothetical protein [Verrucomicrobiota bacterium]